MLFFTIFVSLKFRFHISLFVIIMAIGSLGFTTLFFYNYQSKVVMVEEVQEESGEDAIAQENDYDLLYLHNWSEWMSVHSAVECVDNISLAAYAQYALLQGHFSAPVKPPRS